MNENIKLYWGIALGFVLALLLRYLIPLLFLLLFLSVVILILDKLSGGSALEQLAGIIAGWIQSVFGG